MKLMMIGDYPADASEIEGGVAAAAYNLVKALLEYTNLDISVLTFDRSLRGNDAIVQSKDRLKVISCPMKQRFGLLRQFQHERRLFNTWLDLEQPDVVHAQSEGLYASLAVNCHTPNVYTIHGVRLKELQMIRRRIGWVRYFLSTRMIKEHHQKASNIVVINEYTRCAIEGLHNARLRLIHNAVDEHFFELFTRDQPKPGHLLQVGGVRVRKDVLTAMAALVWLRERNIAANLDIVGPGDAASLQSANEFIQRNELSANVTIHGMVSAEDLDKFYQHADILVMSSIEESSPISIVQGMAAGKPIVSTDVGGIGEMIEEGKNGFLVEAGDAEALGERISRLLGDRNLRSDFARTSRMLAVDEWSTKAVAQKTFEMYKEIQNDR